jgi:hypothetical protein
MASIALWAGCEVLWTAALNERAALTWHASPRRASSSSAPTRSGSSATCRRAGGRLRAPYRSLPAARPSSRSAGSAIDARWHDAHRHGLEPRGGRSSSGWRSPWPRWASPPSSGSAPAAAPREEHRHPRDPRRGLGIVAIPAGSTDVLASSARRCRASAPSRCRRRSRDDHRRPARLLRLNAAGLSQGMLHILPTAWR